MGRTHPILPFGILFLLIFLLATTGYSKELYSEEMKTLNIMGPGSFSDINTEVLLNDIGDATKIVIKFSGVAHTVAKVKIFTNLRTFYETSGDGEFSPFQDSLTIKKDKDNEGWYRIYGQNHVEDLTDRLKIFIHIGTTTGCPWLHYYKGKVEIYTE